MIIFGTDGWRGEIARDFTFENVNKVALATALYVLKNFDGNPVVVVGYDTRFLSRQFAEETAQILAWKGITVHLTNSVASTPQISFQTKQKNAAIGIIITASHNPPIYNGYKIKANFGGPATPEQLADFEKELKRVLAKPPQMKFRDLNYYLTNKKIRLFDAKESYLRQIKKKINIEAIEKAGFKVLYDPMYGSGINTIKNLLPQADEIHGDYNPSFGEIDHPEPIDSCLSVLMERMRSGKYDIGLATDGDADRLGVVDGEGNFVDAHQVFMILLKYLYEQKKKRGAVAKTVSLTSMVTKYCEKNSIKLYETAVGFKHIAKLMNEDKILIGGEESGGLGTILHIPERDGLFNAMLLLEVMAVRGKTLKELCSELFEELGPHHFMRRDVRVTQKQKELILKACGKQPKKIGQWDVINILRTDGFKFFIDGGWLLIRASGTEPLFRFYAEADTWSKVSGLLDEAMKLK